MKKSLLLFSFFPFILNIYAQTGPGGVGDTTGNSNLKLWLQADNGTNATVDNEPVYTWLDHSGAGNSVATATVAAPRLKTNAANGLPGVAFTNLEIMQTSSANATFSNTQATLFVVEEGLFIGAPIGIAEVDIANEFLLQDISAYHHTYSGNFNRFVHECMASIADSTQPVLVCGKYGAAIDDVAVYCNGLLSTTLPVTSGSPLPYTVANRKVSIGGRDNFFAPDTFHGIILEVIGYNVKLNDVDRMKVENYLRCKYQIANNGCGILSTAACSKSTGIEPEPSSAWQLQSTLVHDQLTLTNVSGSEKSSVTILNLLGEAVLTVTAPGFAHSEITLDVNGLAPGMYLLCISGISTSTTLKFIKAN